jgi:hypothetical protein
VTLLGGAILTIVQSPTLPLAASPLLGLMASASGALELAVMAAIWRVRARASAKVAPVAPEAPR